MSPRASCSCRAPFSWLTDATWSIVSGVAATAAVAAFALPLKLNILVAIAAAVAAGLLVEAVQTQRTLAVDQEGAP